MHRLGLITTAGLLALLLTACGEENVPSKPAAKTDNILQRTQKKLDNANKINNTNLKKGIDTNENSTDPNQD